MAFTVLGLGFCFRIFPSGMVPFGFWSSVSWLSSGLRNAEGSKCQDGSPEPVNSHKPEVLNPKLKGVLKVSGGASGFWNVTFRV